METKELNNLLNGIKTVLDGISGVLNTIDKSEKGEKLEAAGAAIDTTERLLENLRKFKK